MAWLRPEQPSVHLEKESTVRYRLLTPAKALFAPLGARGHPAKVTGSTPSA